MSLSLLLVDDEADLLEVLENYLEIFPEITLKVFSNGKDVMAATLDLARVDAIITDNFMPEMMGSELTKKLRQKGYGGKIIMLSANEEPDNLEELGIDLFLNKTDVYFDLDNLVAALSELFPDHNIPKKLVG